MLSIPSVANLAAATIMMTIEIIEEGFRYDWEQQQNEDDPLRKHSAEEA